MIKITNLRLPPLSDFPEIKAACAKKLGVSEGDIESLVILRSAIDARRGRTASRVCTLLVKTEREAEILRKNRDKDIRFDEERKYTPPQKRRKSEKMPIVVGLGPAGLFAALFMARAGTPCVVIERGGDIDSRAAAVERYWQSGVLDKSTNVQFGEGGAGAFSDGKLTTGTHDSRVSAVLGTLHEFGAPEDILWSHKPHVGTDILRDVVRNIRTELQNLGCDIRFNSCVTGLVTENGRLTALKVSAPEGEYELETDAAVFAIGHSARDSFEMLAAREIAMEAKSFAVGVRIEHKQAEISKAQLGELWEKLPPVDYKLVAHLENGRSVFSFCVCPGGVVVASASGEGEVVTNGMSYRARDGENINGALLVGTNPADYGGGDALAGLRFQREWEARAFALGGFGGKAPAQRLSDFLQNRPSNGGGTITPTYKPGVTWCNISACLPDFVSESLREAIPKFGRKIKGFDADDAVLTAIESRSSSPVRILRGEDFASVSLAGLYPCGEGAGYAGGIVSAAVDGIRIAEAVNGAE